MQPAVYLRDYQTPRFFIDKVALRFELDDVTTQVSSRLTLRRNLNLDCRDGELRLDGEQLELVSIALNGTLLAKSAYQCDAHSLTVFTVPDTFVLETVVHIHPATNTALEGLYRSGPVLCTQCEPEGLRKITFFLDRPDVLAHFHVTLIANRQRYPLLLSNGNPQIPQDLGDGRQQIIWDDPFPKPSYLFALVAGDLHWVEDRFYTAAGREVTLRIFVEAPQLDRCAYALQALKLAMAWDEREYGREYDLALYQIVAVSDFNMGAMENKGLNLFNTSYVLAHPDTATDRDFQGIAAVIAHEYFHNWSGNRVTCRDWFQLSLKEGFTVFRDQSFSESYSAAQRIAQTRQLRTIQFAEDASPMAHAVRPDSYLEINNFYTTTVYEKGAEVVRMLRNLLGATTFRQATDLYFTRYDGQAVTVEDFLSCMTEVSGRDLSQFYHWYDQAGTPEITVHTYYNRASATYTLTLRQFCPPTPRQANKRPLHIPVALGLLDHDGNELSLTLAGEKPQIPGTRILELRAEEQCFNFTGLTVPPVPSLLRGGSAPVKVHYDYSDADLRLLMTHDQDGFSRWNAAQTLAQRIILELIKLPAEGLTNHVPAAFITAFLTTLTSNATDQALLAEVLTLPAENYLGEQMSVVDVEGVYRAREAVRRRLGTELELELINLVVANTETAPYRPEPVDIGRRSLKNLALSYLIAGESAAGLELCRAQYQSAHNMTDGLAALTLLINTENSDRDQVLADFETRWQNDALVMDKWFTVQAQSPCTDTLHRVEQLMQHRAFSLSNPNKVRALIGEFASNNPLRFHVANGAGYRFLVDRVLELDPLNPQIAARLLRKLSRWQRYDAARQSLMQAQLQRVVNHQVSRGVYEIAAKSLGAV